MMVKVQFKVLLPLENNNNKQQRQEALLQHLPVLQTTEFVQICNDPEKDSLLSIHASCPLGRCQISWVFLLTASFHFTPS